MLVSQIFPISHFSNAVVITGDYVVKPDKKRSTIKMCYRLKYDYSPTKQMVWGVCWNQPICLSVSVSVCSSEFKILLSGGGIKSNLVTALLLSDNMATKG